MEWNMEWKIINAELVVQNLRREPHSRVMVRRFHKRKSCCHVIAIPQAGICPNPDCNATFSSKKKVCSVHSFPVPMYCIYTPYSSIPRICIHSANRTRVWWLEAEHDNHYTTQLSSMQLKNVVFKPNA